MIEDFTMKKTLDILIVKPNQRPIRATINHDLESMMEIVGGTIEPVYAFRDNACIVVDDEGRMKNYPENRLLFDRYGEPYVVLVGDFFIVGQKGNDFCSLTPKQLDYYERMYYQPEMFVHIGDSIYVHPLPDEMIENNASAIQPTEHDIEL